MPSMSRSGWWYSISWGWCPSEPLDERTKQWLLDLLREFMMSRGDQGAEQSPRRRGPLGYPFVNMATPSRGMVAAGGKAKAESEHGEGLLRLLCCLTHFGLRVAVL